MRVLQFFPDLELKNCTSVYMRLGLYAVIYGTRQWRNYKFCPPPCKLLTMGSQSWVTALSSGPAVSPLDSFWKYRCELFHFNHIQCINDLHKFFYVKTFIFERRDLVHISRQFYYKMISVFDYTFKQHEFVYPCTSYPTFYSFY